MAEVSVLFWSGIKGKSYKAPRVRSILKSLNKRSIKYSYYGIGKPEESCVSEGIFIFNHPRKISKNVEKVVSGLGISSADRYIGGKMLEYYAKNNGICTNEKVLFTQPYFKSVIERAKRNNQAVIIEADFCHPLYAWHKLREAEKSVGIPRRYSDRYNYFPYVKDASKAIEIADKIITFSSHAKESFVYSGIDPNKVLLLPPNAPIDNSFKVSLPRFPRFICTAKHGIVKGTHLLLSAWAEFKNKYAGPSELVLIGSNQRSYKYIEKYANNNPIICLGQSSIPKVYQDYSGCFILCSLLEGRPRTVLEAMACGMPVIASEAASCDIITHGQNGWLVDLTVQSLAEQMLSVANNWSIVKDIGENAMQTIESESCYSYGEKVTEVIESYL